MGLTHDEQRLIENFRKLPPSLRDELLADSIAMLHRASAEAQNDPESAPNQCRLKGKEERPEAAKTPIFTE